MTNEERASLQAYLMNDALFSEEPPPGHVRREGLLFRLGTYFFPKEQGGEFSLNEEEADAAVAAFVPVAGDLEHRPTVLSGQVGIMRRIWREGDEIRGAADVPQWLHDTLDGSKSKISAAFDRPTKTLKGWGWTLDPAIKDAALFTAQATFAATQTDLLAAATAQGRVNAELAAFTGKKREKNMTLIDKLKARLNAGQSNAGVQAARSLQAAVGAIPAGLDQNQLSQLATILQPGQANPLAALTGQNPAQFSTVDSAVVVTAPADVADDAESADAEFRAQQIVTRAEELADRMIADGGHYTYQRDALVAFFSMLGYDNEQSGPSQVTFTRQSDGRVLNDRVQMALEIFSGGPRHTLFSKTLPVTVLNGSKDPAARKSAAEQGAEQAAAFNKSMGVSS